MREYRIAYFTVDWNYELVENTLHGLKKYVDEHEGVYLRVFDCFGKDVNNAKSKSEYVVFDLADLSQFDGVLIQGNQIVLEQARQALQKRVAAAGIPAVTVGCAIEGCTLIGMNDRKAQHEIAAHVFSEHEAKRIVYITGILDNGCAEGQLRLDGFMDACREYKIAQEDIAVFPGTWRTSDGVRIANQWLDEGNELPDAFICANDEMALGVIEVLHERGYTVPMDVIVTGYDNVSSSELSSPRLSTVGCDFARLNYTALDVLIQKINGAEIEDRIEFPFHMVASESCGCGELLRPSYIRDKYFRQTRYLKDLYLMQDQMAEEMFDAADLPQLLDIVEKHQGIFGCEDIYLCINDYYFDNYDKNQWSQNSEVFGENMILAACGNRDYTVDRLHQYIRFPTRQLLPESISKKNRFLVFYPLHYNTYSIGYLALDDVCEAAKLNLHESIFNFLEIATENVRKKCLLRQMNDKLDDLYMRDSLTGLYNRFGYKRFAQNLYDEFIRKTGGAYVIFIDMDDAKVINDRYGHETGDVAIRASARVLKSVCGPEDFLMRYGGDEFFIIASGEAENPEEAIQRAIQEENASTSAPFQLAMSIGCVRSEASDGRTLDDCLMEADALMYENKSKRKAGRR